MGHTRSQMSRPAVAMYLPDDARVERVSAYKIRYRIGPAKDAPLQNQIDRILIKSPPSATGHSPPAAQRSRKLLRIHQAILINHYKIATAVEAVKPHTSIVAASNAGLAANASVALVEVRVSAIQHQTSDRAMRRHYPFGTPDPSRRGIHHISRHLIPKSADSDYPLSEPTSRLINIIKVDPWQSSSPRARTRRVPDRDDDLSRAIVCHKYLPLGETSRSMGT